AGAQPPKVVVAKRTLLAREVPPPQVHRDVAVRLDDGMRGVQLSRALEPRVGDDAHALFWSRRSSAARPRSRDARISSASSGELANRSSPLARSAAERSGKRLPATRSKVAGPPRASVAN